MQPTGGEDAIFFGLFALAFLGGCMFVVGSLVLLIWSIVDCANRTFREENEKIIWILVIVLVGPIGAIIYLIVGRPKGLKPQPPAETWQANE